MFLNENTLFNSRYNPNQLLMFDLWLDASDSDYIIVYTLMTNQLKYQYLDYESVAQSVEQRTFNP